MIQLRMATNHTPVAYALGDQQVTISRHSATKLMASLGYSTPLPPVGRERPVLRNMSVQGRPSLHLYHRSPGVFYLYSPGIEVHRWPTVFDLTMRPALRGQIPQAQSMSIALLHHGYA